MREALHATNIGDTCAVCKTRDRRKKTQDRLYESQQRSRRAVDRAIELYTSGEHHKKYSAAAQAAEETGVSINSIYTQLLGLDLKAS